MPVVRTLAARSLVRVGELHGVAYREVRQPMPRLKPRAPAGEFAARTPNLAQLSVQGIPDQVAC